VEFKNNNHDTNANIIVHVKIDGKKNKVYAVGMVTKHTSCFSVDFVKCDQQLDDDNEK